MISLLTGLMNLNNESVNNVNMNHYNINPDSILVTIGGEYLLGEVNLIKSLANPMDRVHNLNKSYTSPLLLNKMKDDKADIWSIGCVLYEMCSTNPPFPQDSNYPSPVMVNALPSCYSKELNDIILRMLVYDTSQRISLKELMECSYIKEEMEKSSIDDLLKNLLKNSSVPIQIQELNNGMPKMINQTTCTPIEKGITVYISLI